MDDPLDIVTVRWWCECWENPSTNGAWVCVDGRRVCDIRALVDLSDTTFDFPPTEYTRPWVSDSVDTLICVCDKSDLPAPWDVRGHGVLVFTRDMDKALVLRASRMEEWLDRWTPLWRMVRMRAIDSAELPGGDGEI